MSNYILEPSKCLIYLFYLKNLLNQVVHDKQEEDSFKGEHLVVIVVDVTQQLGDLVTGITVEELTTYNRDPPLGFNDAPSRWELEHKFGHTEQVHVGVVCGEVNDNDPGGPVDP